MVQRQFNAAELQAIERMSMVFENLVFDDMAKARTETQRAMALIFAKEAPATFIQTIREKAGQYVEEI